MQKEKKRAHPSITPRSNPRHCNALRLVRHPTWRPHARYAHTHTRAAGRGQRGRQALVDGRRLVLWPGTPTHCACSVRVVRNGHCLFTAQLLALRARAADRTRERACLRAFTFTYLLASSFCAAAVSCWGERRGWRMRAGVGPAAGGTGNCCR